VLLISMGFNEHDVWNMTMDRFDLYTAAVRRVNGLKRSMEMMDTTVSIATAFGGKEGSKKADEYMKEMLK